MEGLFLNRMLAINTATHSEEVVLLGDNSVLAKVAWKSVRNESSKLLTSIDRLLQKGSCNFKNLAGVLCVSGPGPFSAVRIGCAVANAIAYSCGVPVYGVTIEALWHARREHFVHKNRKSVSKESVFVVISAGKGHYALLELDTQAAFLASEAHSLHQVYNLAEISDLLQKKVENLAHAKPVVLCDTTVAEAELLKKTLPGDWQIFTEADTKAVLPFGKTLLALPSQLIYKPEDTIVTPRYLKPPTITESKKPIYAS